MQKKSKKNAPWLTEIVADRDEWVELLGTQPSDKSLAHVGISRSTWQRIASGRNPRVPIASYRLASFCRHGCLGDLAGGAWSDFFVAGDTLVFPGLKYPLSASQLRSTWFQVQESARLRSDVRLLRRELDWVEVSPGVSAWLSALGKRFPTSAENF